MQFMIKKPVDKSKIGAGGKSPTESMALDDKRNQILDIIVSELIQFFIF